MKGDFSRNTFNPKRNYSRVLMQQGRVQLDSDFNEQAAIIIDSMRKLAIDINGKYWVPSEAGFKVNFNKKNSKLFISPGRYYVEGIACENDTNYEIKEPLSKDKNSIIYLDVWERHITFIQDDFIREVALNGPDTCSRAEIVWNVRAVPTDALEQPSSHKYINDLREKKKQTLKIQLNEVSSCKNICSIPPESRYRGLENQLYRFEIHKKGIAWNGINEHGNPAGNVQDAATFKWSRENGSVVFPVKYMQGNIVTLENLGRDERSSLKVGDWVEIVDDVKECDGIAGVMAQVEKIDTVKMMVTLKSPPEISSTGLPSYENNAVIHPLLRRWDHRAKSGVAMHAGAILIKEEEPIEIENGIEVIFTKYDNNAVDYRTGDYWLTCARIATGNIDWPMDDSGKVPKALQPFGIQHYYAPLAIYRNGNEPLDCRSIKDPCCKPKDI